LTATNQTSPTKRYVDAFLDDASECLLIWRDLCENLQSTPLHLQPRLGWDPLHVVIERLLDGAKRVDFLDLAQFLDTMLEPVALIRDGLLPPSKLVIETLNQTHEVVEKWIHNFSRDNYSFPATDLVRFAAETASQAIAAPTCLPIQQQESTAPQESTLLQGEMAALKALTERQSGSLVVLDQAVARLEQLAAHEGLRPTSVTQAVTKVRTAPNSTKREYAPTPPFDRETLAQVRGKVLRRALPTAYIVFKLGKNLMATRASDLAPILPRDLDFGTTPRTVFLTLETFAHSEVPTTIEVESVEGFFNMSDEHIDQDVIVQSSIPKKWHRGVASWNGETVSLVDI